MAIYQTAVEIFLLNVNLMMAPEDKSDNNYNQKYFILNGTQVCVQNSTSVAIEEILQSEPK